MRTQWIAVALLTSGLAAGCAGTEQNTDQLDAGGCSSYRARTGATGTSARRASSIKRDTSIGREADSTVQREDPGSSLPRPSLVSVR